MRVLAKVGRNTVTSGGPVTVPSVTVPHVRERASVTVPHKKLRPALLQVVLAIRIRRGDRSCGACRSVTAPGVAPRDVRCRRTSTWWRRLCRTKGFLVAAERICTPLGCRKHSDPDPSRPPRPSVYSTRKNLSLQGIGPLGPKGRALLPALGTMGGDSRRHAAAVLLLFGAALPGGAAFGLSPGKLQLRSHPACSPRGVVATPCTRAGGLWLRASTDRDEPPGRLVRSARAVRSWVSAKKRNLFRRNAPAVAPLDGDDGVDAATPGGVTAMETTPWGKWVPEGTELQVFFDKGLGDGTYGQVHKPSTLTPKPQTLNPEPSTRDPKSQTPNPKP